MTDAPGFVPVSQMDGLTYGSDLVFGSVTNITFDLDPNNFFARMGRFKKWLRKSQRTTRRRLRFEANRGKG